ncbi:hypothetical protein BV372_29675 [Nostoc sp. T09]|uniref:hypothetical protein n=1 Tax=Nostoc sp. T09 TaxID=1932621 RepID=UPI000A36ACAA|nr:hypothetical protein [Nostoc sp. T09]OUL23647.1 hypothetical protein BV372_29675 [Nostoc sp. T09]
MSFIDELASATENLTRRVCDANKAADAESTLDFDCEYGGTIASCSDRFSNMLIYSKLERTDIAAQEISSVIKFSQAEY